MFLPKRTAILVAVALTVCPAAVFGQELRVASIGTGAIAGNYYAIGRALCAAVHEIAPTDLHCSPEPTPGSHYNLIALADGGMEFAIVQSDWQRDAARGEGRFAESGPVAGLRGVASLYPEAVTIVVPGASDVETLDDLRGRAIDIGDVASARRATNLSLLEAVGFAPSDIAGSLGVSDAAIASELCAGRVDASMIVIGHPSDAIRDILDACDLRLLAMDRTVLHGILATNAEFSAYTLPADTYETVDRDLPMLAVMATLVVREGVEADMVSAFTRALTDEAEVVARRAPVFEMPLPQVMARDGMTAPLHPAAAAVLGVDG